MKSITESITMKNCLLGLILKSSEASVLSALSLFFFLKNAFEHHAASERVRILLFSKIIKIQTSLNSLKYVFYGQVYHRFGD